MPEQESPIEQLLAQARQKDAAVKQERTDRAETARQATVTSQVDKLYADREDQMRFQEEIKEKDAEARRQWDLSQSYTAELQKLSATRKEADEKLADQTISEDAKSIYRQVLDQVNVRETELNQKIKDADDANGTAWKSIRENQGSINATTREAAELMGYGKNSPKVDRKAEFIPDKDFEQIAEYVQKMRELKARAKEGEKQIKVDQLAETVWKQIQSYASRRTRSTGSEGYVHEVDSDSLRLNSPEFLLDNPMLIKTIREKVFEKVKALEAPAEAEDWRGKTTDLMQKAMQSEVFIQTKDIPAKGVIQKVRVWAGGHFNPLTSYSSESERLPFLDEQGLTDEQKAKISQAVENPNIPIQELKMDLGFKYDPETVARIQEDALKENAEVDRQRELKRLEQKIDELAAEISRIEDLIKDTQAHIVVFEKNFQYSKLENQSTNQGNEVHSLKTELERNQRDIENLPKGLFGQIKDKAKLRSLEERNAEIEKILPEKSTAYESTKIKMEQVKQELGADFMKRYYEAGDLLKTWQSRLKHFQTDLDRDSRQLEDLRKQRIALEAK